MERRYPASRGTPLEAGVRHDGNIIPTTPTLQCFSYSCLLSHNYTYCHRYDPRESSCEERDNIAQRYPMMKRASEAAGPHFFTSSLSVPEPFITLAALALLARQRGGDSEADAQSALFDELLPAKEAGTRDPLVYGLCEHVVYDILLAPTLARDIGRRWLTQGRGREVHCLQDRRWTIASQNGCRYG